ncbi:MAG: endonuclease III domain-containing protein [Cuniculiplasma sp.]
MVSGKKPERTQITEIINLMKRQSPPHHFEFMDPFWVLITTIMSHRTKDEVTDSAARGLYKKYSDCMGLSEAKYEDVLDIIQKVGFKTVKAGRVIEAAKYLREKYNCTVPESLEALTEIKGVGRKTANVVLSDGFGIPAIAVDTHVQRISKRLGWTDSENPDETEVKLRKLIPKDLWLGLNPMMVEFGKKICRPVGPKCEECNVSDFCDYFVKRESEVK